MNTQLHQIAKQKKKENVLLNLNRPHLKNIFKVI